MKVPSSPPEKPAAAKSQPLPAPLPEPGPRRAEEAEYVPRYVALPKRWERGHGRRNLVAGVVLLVITVFFLGWALYLAGPGAIFTVAACVATATLLYVMARSRLFRQRNGGFVAWVGVCLLGVVLVILHHGFVSLTAGRQAPGAAKSEPAVGAPASGPTPLLRDTFPPTNDIIGGPAVRIVRDTKVSVDGKPYLAKQGEFYPLVDVTVDDHGMSQLRFAVGTHDVLIAKGAAEVAGSDNSVPGLDPGVATGKGSAGETRVPAKDFEPPKGLSKQEQELASQREAIRRYPALGRSGSQENRLFLSARKELQMSGENDFFRDPNWPLILADNCAEKEGWVRADIPAPEPPRPVPPTDSVAGRLPGQ